VTAARDHLVGIDRVRAASRVLEGIAARTPLVGFGPAEDGVLLKAESLQPIGAFKLRGAYVAVASLEPGERERGVITYSSGNHAQGVARAARLFGVPAVIVMPSDAPAIKRARVADDGAEIVTVGTASEERRVVAERIAAERGLASGVAVAVKALHPRARVIGVEPELAADARESLETGRIVEWPAALVSRTIADGTRTQSLGRRTFAHLAALMDGVLTVTEAEIVAGVRLAAEESRLVVEPSGALTVAAMRFRRDGILAILGGEPPTGPIVAVVSGGNVDPADYLRYLSAPLPD
jgi:threonine dehydratase